MYSADLIRRMRLSRPTVWDGEGELTPRMATAIVSHARDWTGDCIRVGALMVRWGEHELDVQVEVDNVLADAWVACVGAEPSERIEDQ